jgi:hypothetical protein
MDLGLLISGPKKFMAQKNTRAEDIFIQSLIFLGVSIVLFVIMTAPLRPSGIDLWTYLAANAGASLLSVSLFAVALRVAWRLVGGKSPIGSFFVTYAYFFGTVIIILMPVLFLSEGVFKVLAPDLYAQVVHARLNKQPMPDLSGSSVPLIAFIILLAGFSLISVWGVIAWGAYRQLNSLSKWRSFIAFMIMGLLSLPIGSVAALVQTAMMVK